MRKIGQVEDTSVGALGPMLMAGEFWHRLFYLMFCPRVRFTVLYQLALSLSVGWSFFNHTEMIIACKHKYNCPYTYEAFPISVIL